MSKKASAPNRDASVRKFRSINSTIPSREYLNAFVERCIDLGIVELDSIHELFDGPKKHSRAIEEALHHNPFVGEEESYDDATRSLLERIDGAAKTNQRG